MIGHKSTGKGFQGLVSYVLGKEGARRLPVGTLAGQTPVELATEVSWLRQARKDLSKPVLHRTLSLAPGEELSVLDWSWAAIHYMSRMGLDSSPWFAVIHEDAGCQHLHICSLAIDPTRTDRFGRPARVSDSHDFARSAKIIQAIEKKLGLRPGAMTPAEAAQFMKRQPPSAHVQRLARTGECPEKVQLQARIDAALDQARDFRDFQDRLELAGVEIRMTWKGGKLTGLSYGFEDYRAKASQLGKRYTAACVLQHLEGRNDSRERESLEGRPVSPGNGT